MSLLELIHQRIHASGAISVADYMALCLDHPDYGYYHCKPPFGSAGDFTTAPEISQIFGEICGLWLAMQWLAQGSPSPCQLVELGPGRATLMQDALRATRHIPGFHDALTITLVETSHALTRQQQERLHNAHPRIHWQRRLEDALKPMPLWLIANEFFDALPVEQWQHTHGQWKKRVITLQEGKLAFTTRDDAPHANLPTDAGEGDIAETAPTREAITAQLAQHIADHGGAALIIDYGYAHGHGDSLQAIRQHRYANVLEEPGQADLTAHVDFAALARVASAAAAVYGPVHQANFLSRMGAQARAAMLCKQATQAQKAPILSGLERLLSPDAMGVLFKCLAVMPPSAPAPEGF